MTAMLAIEIRRCFARRLVRWLIVVAVFGCVLAGVLRRPRRRPGGRPTSSARRADGRAVMRFLGVAAFFLLIGAVVGGASMIGAEWRAGTFVTLLTWEPDRRASPSPSLAACGLVAAGSASCSRCSSAPPSSRRPGAPAPPRAWTPTGGLAGRSHRPGGMPTGLAALLMAAIAMIGRNTAAALGAAFGYLMLVENLVRAWKPWAGRFLLGQNSVMFLGGGQVEGAPFAVDLDRLAQPRRLRGAGRRRRCGVVLAS